MAVILEPYSLAVQVRYAPLVLRTMLGYAEPPREQPALASLESELSDSASLGYLRRRSASCDAEVEKSFLLRQKERYGTPEWVFRIFGGEERI